MLLHASITITYGRQPSSNKSSLVVRTDRGVFSLQTLAHKCQTCIFIAAHLQHMHANTNRPHRHVADAQGVLKYVTGVNESEKYLLFVCQRRRPPLIIKINYLEAIGYCTQCYMRTNIRHALTQLLISNLCELLSVQVNWMAPFV